MSVEFHDFSIQVKNAIEEKAIAFLHEAGSEVKSAAARNSRVDSGELKGSWNYKVDEAGKKAEIGSPEQNAIWEEFGTGEYAVNGDGRKGYWVFVDDGSGGGARSTGKSYTLAEAKKVMAIMRKKGLEAYYTKGKKPNHTLQKAFDSRKAAIINRAKQIFGELGS